MKLNKIKSLLVCAVIGITACLPMSLAGCGKKDDNTFSVWLASGEKDTYYSDYAKNPILQYLSKKEWGPEGEKTKLKFEYSSSHVNAKDEFANLTNGSSYNDIMSLDYAQESILYYYEQGIAMDITDYVNEYMPNYKALVESNPEIYRDAVTIVDGKPRYLNLVSINDGPNDMYQGFMYRRDWLVRFGEMPEYIWNWGEDITANKISKELTQAQRAEKAPTITNYFRAREAYGADESKWTANGWKKNPAYDASKNNDADFTVKVGGTRGCGITSSYGANPKEDYTDNLVFPSGTNEPVFLSDWEWMFETVETKVWDNQNYKDNKGTLRDNDAYMTSVCYYGTSTRGDFSSCFGKGSPSIYFDASTGKMVNGYTSESTRLYLEYMNEWYKKGWLDSEFSSRSGDLFYQIDTASTSAGYIFAMSGKMGQAADGLDNDSLPFTEGIMFTGARLPMNDVKGAAEYKFVTPDTIYQEGLVSSKCMITTEAEGKNLPALFTYLDYGYSEEGAKLYTLGFSKEQYEETQDEYYKKWNLTEGAYKVIPDSGNGKIYTWADNNPAGTDFNSSTRLNRLPWGYRLVSKIDNGFEKIYNEMLDNWKVYPNTGDIMSNLLNKIVPDNEYNLAYTQMMETLTIKMSPVIKANDKTFNYAWNTYKDTIGPNGDVVRERMQQVYDMYNDLLNNKG